MSIMTVEGIIDQGQVHLPANVQLPDRTKVYVVIPDIQIEQTVHIYSPRLANPGQAADFVLEIIEDSSDDEL